MMNQELRNLIEKAAKENVYGVYLPDQFVSQYYEALIQTEYKQPTYEDLLKQEQTPEEKKKILKKFFVHVMNYITAFTKDIQDAEQEEIAEDEFLNLENENAYDPFDHPFDQYDGIIGAK